MHAVVITFDLVDMTAARYEEIAAELAPAFAALPGLLTKVWLADTDAARYGGFYLFADAAAADAYLGSALGRGVAEHPSFARIEVRRFAVDEATTLHTQPGLAVVAAQPV